jgi:DNA-binding HxlR family transcriptional regulator
VISRTQCPQRVIDLFHHRWTLPVLAAVHHGGGARLATLSHQLQAGRPALRESIRFATNQRWLMRNPGHGHPLRPEYILTVEAKAIGRTCFELWEAIRRADLEEVALLKWSMPVLRVLGDRPARFCELRASLTGIGDRALAMTLRDLRGADLIRREVLNVTPPAVTYDQTRQADPLIQHLKRL